MSKKLSLQELMNFMTFHQFGMEYERLQQEAYDRIYDTTEDAFNYVWDSIDYLINIHEMFRRLQTKGRAEDCAGIIAVKCKTTKEIEVAVRILLTERASDLVANYELQHCAHCFPMSIVSVAQKSHCSSDFATIEVVIQLQPRPDGETCQS